LATKLEIYNGALILLGARTIATLADVRAERRSLDGAWNLTLDYMMDAAIWHFAAKTDELSPSDTVESNFGYQYVYEKPDDYVRLIKICDNDRLTPTLADYSEESDYFLTDSQPLYIQYVSNSIEYGADPGKWSGSFAAAFIDELAYRVSAQISNVPITTKDWLEKKKRRSMYYAKGKSAVNQCNSTLPVGRLVKARAGTRYLNAMRRTPYA
jgi:hypothetical protein